MKKVILLLFSVCSMFSCTHTPNWELVWEDNFNGTEPDTAIWSRIPAANQTGKTPSHRTTVVMKCVTVFLS